MAFSVSDFQDLVRLLDEHPEWRAALRRQILSDELLELPELVRSLAEAQRRTDEQLAALTAQIDALTTRLDSLVERVDFVVDRMGDIDGDVMELRFARRAPAYLGRLARRLRVLEPSQLADILDDAIEAGKLSDEDRESILLADVVARGRRRTDGAEVYLVAEVSSGVGVDDVGRVLARSSKLQKLGEPVVPLVVGRWINHDARRYASASGVEQVLMPRRPNAKLFEPRSGEQPG